MPHWLRWLLVLPASVAAWIAVQLLITLGNYLTWETSWYLFELFVYVMNSVVGGWVFVQVGARVAPRGKFATAVLLAALHGVLVGGAVLINLAIPDGEPLFSRTVFYLGSVLGIGATVLACSQVWAEGLPSSLPERDDMERDESQDESRGT